MDATELKTFEKYSKIHEWGSFKILDKIPKEDRKYKCVSCGAISRGKFGETGGLECPECGNVPLEIMCPLDHCHCGHDISTSITYCAMCGRPICPWCGCHDVVQISRVTGYLQDVAGFNASKKQELKDRTRYEVATR